MFGGERRSKPLVSLSRIGKTEIEMSRMRHCWVFRTIQAKNEKNKCYFTHVEKR
jgi:hypothetical protein